MDIKQQQNKAYFAPMHTAEHILNATMVATFNCNRSFSNHIERKKSKCDYKFDRELTDIEIETIQNKVNEVIGNNLDVTESFISRDEAEKKFSLTNLPESAGDTLRIVKVGDYDECLCIGDHVSNTSEIKKFKIISTNFNDGVLRLRYKLVDKL